MIMPKDGGPRCSPDSPIIDRIVRYLEWRGDCLEWTGSTARNGYGSLKIKGCNYVATRLVMEMIHGPIAPGVEVCHTCDNPPCCNPDHLFLGTRSDNVRDMLAKGRRRTRVRAGLANHKARHSDATVQMVRNRRADGETFRSIACDVGVSMSTIQRWVGGATRTRSGEYVAQYHLRQGGAA